MTGDLSQIASSLYEGDEESVSDLVQKLLNGGAAADQILQEGLIAGMDRVGKDFKDGVLFVPEVLVAARAMHAGMDILRPLLTQSSARNVGKCVIGTVKGDLHDIGKNLVKMMLEGAGFEIIDLGTDVDPQAFVEAVREHKPKLVGMSALLTTTMQNMKATIDEIGEAGLRDSTKIILGGAPVTEDYAMKCGADGYASNAAAAVDLARALTA
ncbi:MAG: corrinoid protein [Chloroflexota bacterium]|nr:cobalamin-binding protein [Chloroflexota bacterium]